MESMKLKDFKGKYESLNMRNNLSGNDAMKAVEQNGDSLQYVSSDFFKDVIMELTITEIADKLGIALNCLKIIK